MLNEKIKANRLGRAFACVCLTAAALLAGCGGGPETATVTIEVEKADGKTVTTASYDGPGGRAEDTVTVSDSALTDHNAAEGDFAAVYEKLAGKPHPIPREMTTAQQVLDAATIGGWSVAEDDRGNSKRTVKLTRGEEED